MAENSREFYENSGRGLAPRSESNKEKILQYNREYGRAYRSAHKEQINEKFICDVCGGKTTRSNISKHLKTKKHIKFVQSITNPC
jgi:hypothetical protein